MQLDALLSATLPIHDLPRRKPMIKVSRLNWQDALKLLNAPGV